MPRYSPGPRKRRTREHVIADRSINHVERQVLQCDYFLERWLHDYGMDLVLWTFTGEGEVERGSVFLQVKATDHLELSSSGRFVSCRIERTDLRAWLTEPMPVILILYDAQADRAYWLYVQAIYGGVRRFRSVKGSESLSVRIPVNQVVDPEAIQRFRTFRDRINEQNKGVVHHE